MVSSRDQETKEDVKAMAWPIPYHVIRRDDPDISVVLVYFETIEGNRCTNPRVFECPPELPAGFYWYSGNRNARVKFHMGLSSYQVRIQLLVGQTLKWSQFVQMLQKIRSLLILI